MDLEKLMNKYTEKVQKVHTQEFLFFHVEISLSISLLGSVIKVL